MDNLLKEMQNYFNTNTKEKIIKDLRATPKCTYYNDKLSKEIFNKEWHDEVIKQKEING